jgi:hypothetical protein
MSIEVAALFISVIAILTSAIGWFVVHALSVRTQNQSLINSLLNDARLVITKDIRVFIDRVVELRSEISTARVDVEDPIARKDRSVVIRMLIMDKANIAWAERLEEYECLFPETASVRVELLDMYEASFASSHAFADIYENEPRVVESQEKDKCLGSLIDLMGLTWDLLIHVQNKSIGQITGHRVPERQVESDKYPRLVSNRDGNLIILKREVD